MNAPRGPAGPPTRRYLLAGLLRCGQYGRRLESAWSNGKPSYRCRHGYTSATRPEPGRPKNLYLREDQILPRLAALAILHARQDGERHGGKRAITHLTAPATAANLIDHLRAARVTLIYDPGTRTFKRAPLRPWASASAKGVSLTSKRERRPGQQAEHPRWPEAGHR